MSDQQYLQFQKERRLRDIAIENAERAQKVGNFFFAQHQKVLYPNATMYYEPPTYASLIESETNVRDESQQRDILFGNLMTIMSQEKEMAKKISQVGTLQEIEILNPYFSDFKAKFLETFSGKPVPYNTFMNFIHKYLSDKSSTIQANMENIKQEESRNEQTYDNNNPPSGSSSGQSPPANKKPSPEPKAPKSENKSSPPQELKSQGTKRKKSQLNAPKKLDKKTLTTHLMGVFATPGVDYSHDVKGRYQKHNVYTPPQDEVEYVVGGTGFYGKRITGNGVVTPTPINNSVSRFYVDMKHLNKNILSVKYSSTKNFKIKPIAISENVKSLIMDILLGRFNSKVYDLLPPDDKKIIQLFVRELRIDDLVQIDQEDMEKMYKDFSVLRGEYFAGNTSEQVKRALRKITLELMDVRRIPKHQGIQLLYELSL
jgi:hypothetical protein